MLLRRFLARAQAALRSMSREERHRRAAERDRLGVRPALGAAEAAEVSAMGELVEAWHSGEQKVIPPALVTLPWPVVRPPTKAERFAADPLRAPLAEVERSSPFYRSVLDGQADWMSQDTIDRLESPTGTWTRGDIAALLAERAG